MLTEEHLRAYLRHVAEDLQRAPGTVAGYRGELGLLVSRRVLLEPEALASFISCHPDGRPLAVTTRNRRLAVVRGLMRYLVKVGVLAEDPAREVRRARVPRRRREAFTTTELDRVCAVLATEPASWRRTRDLSSFLLFYYTGLRVTELQRLDRHQVDLGAALLRDALRKGGSTTDVILHPAARSALLVWLSERPAPEATPLYTDAQGVRLSVRMIQKRLRALGRAAGLVVPLHPHRIRHAHATGLLRVGVPTELIRQSMNHRSLATTETYLHGDEGLLREAIGKLPTFSSVPFEETGRSPR